MAAENGTAESLSWPWHLELLYALIYVIYGAGHSLLAWPLLSLCLSLSSLFLLSLGCLSHSHSLTLLSLVAHSLLLSAGEG